MRSHPVTYHGPGTRTRRIRSAAGRAVLGGTTAILVGTIVATVGAYLFQVVGGRALGAAAFLPVTGPAPAAQAAGTTYYVDALAGSDSNSGTSTSEPFSTR